MSEAESRQSLEEAFDSIEETILPSLSTMIDTMLEAATLARPGVDAEVYAAELRTIALQLEALTRQVVISGGNVDPRLYAEILSAQAAEAARN